MPISTKQSGTRGIPRKASSPSRHAKQGRYLARATCMRCQLVFRSPKYKKRHAETGHTSLMGVNRKRCDTERWQLLNKGTT